MRMVVTCCVKIQETTSGNFEIYYKVLDEGWERGREKVGEDQVGSLGVGKEIIWERKKMWLVFYPSNSGRENRLPW